MITAKTKWRGQRNQGPSGLNLGARRHVAQVRSGAKRERRQNLRKSEAMPNISEPNPYKMEENQLSFAAQKSKQAPGRPRK